MVYTVIQRIYSNLIFAFWNYFFFFDNSNKKGDAPRHLLTFRFLVL